MTKKWLVSKSLLLAAMTFIIAYVACCYVPPLRIKLVADPLTYLVESMKHMAVFKAAVSAAAACLAGALTWFLGKKSKSGQAEGEETC